VADVEVSLRFYVERLGFTSPWRYDDDGRARIAQVDRQGCALILADTQFFRENRSGAFGLDRVGKGLVFISLNVEPHSDDQATAAVDALLSEFQSKGVHVKDGSWGYRLVAVEDPDGNQLFFNYPAEAAS